MARFLTLNTFLLEVRLFGRVPVYPVAPSIEPRLHALPAALAATGADVIALQEVFRRPHRLFLANELKVDYPFVAGLRHSGLPLGTGLMVLSRHPIGNADPHEFRAALVEERIAIRMGMLDCRIDLPDLGEVRFVDFHLVAGGLGGHPEGRRGETCRARQIDELIALARAPGPPTTIMAGDLNAGREASPANYHQLLNAGFRDCVTEAAEGRGAAMTWDPENPLITGELNRSLPPQRMDQVFLREAGSEHLSVDAAKVVLSERTIDVGEAAPVPVSDHYGVAVDIVIREAAAEATV